MDRDYEPSSAVSREESGRKRTGTRSPLSQPQRLEGQYQLPGRCTVCVVQKGIHPLRVPPEGVHTLIVRLAAGVRQLVAVAAAEVPGTIRQVQLAPPGGRRAGR